MITSEVSDVLSLPEAAAYLRCHPRTLRLMAIRGSVPARRVGWLWRFSQQRLDVWIREAAWDSPAWILSDKAVGPGCIPNATLLIARSLDFHPTPSGSL